MAMREELEHSGNWLFRWRGYLPLVLICGFLAVMRTHEFPGHSEKIEHIWEAICLLVSLCGLGIRVATIGYTPRGTSGRNTEKQDAETLNTAGLYSVVRNPLYLGNFVMYLGIALLTGVWWLVLIYVLVFWLYYERIIFAEESFLRRQFGQEYLDWAAVTPVIVPRLKGYRRPPLSFSLKNVLRREYNGFFALVLIMALFEVVGDLFAHRGLELDRGWAVIIGVSFVIWITLRSLKRHTTVLNVEGR